MDKPPVQVSNDNPDTTVIGQPENLTQRLKTWVLAHKNLTIISIVVLIGVGLSAGWILQRNHKTEPKAAQSANHPASSNPTASSSELPLSTGQVSGQGFYITSIGDKEDVLLKVSYQNGVAQQLASQSVGNGKTFDNVVQLSSNSYRVFYDNYSSSSTNSTQSLSYQDTGQPEKKIFSVNSTSTDNNQFVTSYIDANGRYADIVLFTKAARFIERVNLDGTIAFKYQEPSTPVYIPKEESANGQTIYLEVDSCYFCDGAGHADLATLNTGTGKFSTIYSDPNGDSYTGGWKKAGDNFWLSSSNEQGLGVYSYQEALKYKTYVYNYSLTSGQSKTIFTGSPPNEADAFVAGSNDGKKVFLAMIGFQKGDYDSSSGQYSADYERSGLLRIYDAASSNYSLVNLGKGFANSQDVGGTSSTFIYSVSSGQTADSTYSIYKLDLTESNAQPVKIYTGAKGNQLSIIKF